MCVCERERWVVCVCERERLRALSTEKKFELTSPSNHATKKWLAQIVFLDSSYWFHRYKTGQRFGSSAWLLEPIARMTKWSSIAWRVKLCVKYRGSLQLREGERYPHCLIFLSAEDRKKEGDTDKWTQALYNTTSREGARETYFERGGLILRERERGRERRGGFE